MVTIWRVELRVTFRYCESCDELASGFRAATFTTKIKKNAGKREFLATNLRVNLRATFAK